jgi:hypothetical protein
MAGLGDDETEGGLEAALTIEVAVHSVLRAEFFAPQASVSPPGHCWDQNVGDTGLNGRLSVYESWLKAVRRGVPLLARERPRGSRHSGLSCCSVGSDTASVFVHAGRSRIVKIAVDRIFLIADPVPTCQTLIVLRFTRGDILDWALVVHATPPASEQLWYCQ